MPSRRARRRLRSLRFRLTLVVTVAVGLALTLASVVLVTVLSNTLVGRAEAAAGREVDRVADALAAGRPAPEEQAEPAEYITAIKIVDERGHVVQTIPDVSAEAAPERPVPTAGAAVPGAAAGPEQPPPDNLVVASRTVPTPDGQRTVIAVSRLGAVSDSVHLVVNSLLVATPLLTVVVAFGTWYAVDRALRPIESVRRRAEEISHSTLDERLPQLQTGDEVGRLTTTLNSMLERLEDGARRQREFVSDASHELRTPLAAMRAELEVALLHRGADDWRKVARRLLDDHDRIDRLTADLLVLSRTDDATTSPRAEVVDLADVVAGEVVALTRAEVVVELEPAPVTGVVPELARLVRNLLDNADRHATRAVAVRLYRPAPGGDVVLLAVDDDGPGIPEQFRERVFDRFFRLDDGRARTVGGTGLGLAMARGIARRHDGDITVTTAPLGGARFELRLPLALAMLMRGQNSHAK